MAKIWKYLLLIFCLFGAAKTDAAQEKPALFSEGQQVFASNCADCHRSSGEGLPNTFPALKENSFVMGDPVPVIQTILNGRKGKTNRMPAWKDKLSDQQIAAVVNFIRNYWGNSAPAVTPALVAANRKE